MKILYSIGVKTPAGWRQVGVLAEAKPLTAKMAEVVSVLEIDGEKPAYGQSRTGAKRQQFNGLYFAKQEIGKHKRLSACEILENHA